ncbi:MAG: lysozyme inhibitor LprI family protein [Rhodanobacter sp.]
MKLPLTLILVATLAPVSIAWADDCANANSQADMSMCAEAAYKKVDAELNAAYRHIMERLKSNQASARLLVTAQKSWLGFRDAECAFNSSGTAGGSIQPMLVTQCREDLTRKRVQQLKNYLQCQEGDTSCPVPAN